MNWIHIAEQLPMLPCPFCGADNWTQQTVHSTVRILTHREECWIGRSEIRQDTWINPGSELAALWNKRAYYQDPERVENGIEGMIETLKSRRKA